MKHVAPITSITVPDFPLPHTHTHTHRQTPNASVFIPKCTHLDGKWVWVVEKDWLRKPQLLRNATGGERPQAIRIPHTHRKHLKEKKTHNSSSSSSSSSSSNAIAHRRAE